MLLNILIIVAALLATQFYFEARFQRGIIDFKTFLPKRSESERETYNYESRERRRFKFGWIMLGIAVVSLIAHFIAAIFMEIDRMKKTVVRTELAQPESPIILKKGQEFEVTGQFGFDVIPEIADPTAVVILRQGTHKVLYANTPTERGVTNHFHTEPGSPLFITPRDRDVVLKLINK
jgi:hypothetical protein